MIIKPTFGNADSADHRSGGPGIAQVLRDVADDLNASRDFLNDGLALLSAPYFVPRTGAEYFIRSLNPIWFISDGMFGVIWDYLQYLATTDINTGAGEFRKVLLSADFSIPDAYELTVATHTIGDVAASQDEAVLPDVPAGEVALAYLEIPENFTGGTTSFTQDMIKEYPVDGFAGITVPKTQKG